MSIQHLINPVLFTQNQECLQLVTPINAFGARVRQHLSDKRSDCTSMITGYIDKKGRPILRVDISLEAKLACQRCLEEMQVPLHSRSDIVLCLTEAELDKTLDNLEDLDAVLMTEQMDIIELIEDEIIMSLPFAAKHEQCILSIDKTLSDGKENPFAVLSQLKKN